MPQDTVIAIGLGTASGLLFALGCVAWWYIQDRMKRIDRRTRRRLREAHRELRQTDGVVAARMAALQKSLEITRASYDAERRLWDEAGQSQ